MCFKCFCECDHSEPGHFKEDEPVFTGGEAFAVPEGDAPVAGWVNMGGPIDRGGGDAAVILAMLSQMTESVRYEAIKSIIERYCQHCGTSNKPSRCRCWDDD